MAQPSMRTSIYRGSCVVHVVLHGRRFPSDEEWSRFMDEVVGLTAELGATDLHRGLIITDGGAPTSKQRALLRESIGEAHVVVAQVTASRLALGIATAVRWINPALRSFAPKDLPRALTYLGIPAEEWPSLFDHIEQHRGDFEIVTLDAMTLPAPRMAR